MKSVVFTIVATAVVALHSASASAQAVRTFVSGLGSDTNPCSGTQPCRTLAHAISMTNAGGEIVVLDSSGYGTLTISKAITITAVGVDAAISIGNAGDDGIDITAGASDAVNLNGLTLIGNGIGTSGISLSSAGTLNIQNCSITGFGNDGIFLGGAATSSLSDTIIANNGQHGVEFDPSAAANASFLRVQMLGNQNDFFLENFNASGTAVAASLEDSVVAGSSSAGINVESINNATTTTVNLSNSQVFNNNLGLEVANGVINLEQVTLFGNGPTGGYSIGTGGVINTFRTTVSGTNFNGNYIVDTTNTGSLTPAAPQ
jgi:hypothetical protein